MSTADLDLELDGVRLRYRDTGRGTGTPLLLVHGWGGDLTDWDPVVAALAPERRLITVDLRGHGGSSTLQDGYAPADFAADLAGLLRAVGAPAVAAVGHSMGAQAAVALALAHPSAVSSVVAVDPAYGADDSELRRIPAEQRQLLAEGSAWAVRFADGAHTATTPAAVRERHARLMAAMDPGVLAAARDAMYLAPGAFGPRRAAEATLATLTCPVLTLMSTPERAAWARGVPQRPGSRAEFIASGHYLHEEHPDRIAELLREWTAAEGEPSP